MRSLPADQLPPICFHMDKFVDSRRQFLKFVGKNSAVIGLSPLMLNALSLSGCASTSKSYKVKGLAPSFKDDLLLSDGLSYNIISKWGDVINKDNDVFGSNNDFNCFLPLDGKSDEGLLWVNHEFVVPQFVHNKDTKNLTRSKAEMAKEQKLVGGSILHLKKQDNQWNLVKDSKYNRRLDANTPIPFSNQAKIQGKAVAIGTLANCAGGVTPWNTFLTSEENYEDFYGEAHIVNGKRKLKFKDKFNWYKHFKRPPEHYGWVVEVDPETGKAEKQVSLGRAPHEGASVALTKDDRVAVYMGEDRPGGFIYKFVSTGKHFKEGTLYAADTKNGKWLALDIKKNPKLKKLFKNQLEVLTYSHQAAELVGATPQDRPEDIEIHPFTGEVFVSLTNNPVTGNKYGSLLKISEEKDHDSENFKASTWVSGGLETGMACPDNLCFDKRGNLWVTVDMSEKKIGTGSYKEFGHNGLFYIATSGPQAGKPIQVASAPRDAELTGPWFSPDYKTLFLSVQHPGTTQRFDMSKQKSTWPDGKGKLPKSSVVAIQGDLFDKII